jgi:hypothetical protein
MNRKARKERKAFYFYLAFSLAPPATVRAASTPVRDGRAGVALFAVKMTKSVRTKVV